MTLPTGSTEKYDGPNQQTLQQSRKDGGALRRSDELSKKNIVKDVNKNLTNKGKQI